MQAYQFGDREMLADALHTQRETTASYNFQAGECASETLKNDLLSLLDDEHAIQYNLYTSMHARGWYPVPSAGEAAVQQARQTYPQQLQ